MDRSLQIAVVGLAVLAVVLFLFLPDPARDPSGADRVTITYCGGGLGRDRLMFDDLKAVFERRHPEIRLRFIRGTASLERKVDTMIAGGAAPDVLSVNVDQVAHYTEGGALLDLTPFILEDARLAADLEPAGDFYEILTRPFRSADGTWRLLPVWYTPFFVYYNKDLFDTYAVPYPDEDWDWEGMRERARAPHPRHRRRRPHRRVRSLLRPVAARDRDLHPAERRAHPRRDGSESRRRESTHR